MRTIAVLTLPANYLQGTTFSIAGKFTLESAEDVIAEIQQYGGKFSNTVTSAVQFVLSCEEMAHVLENPYKLQFLPELKTQVEAAQMHSVKIVDVEFLHECIRQRSNRVDPAPYILHQFTVDVESKYKIQSDIPSSLDPRVQSVIQELFDQKELDRSLVDMGMDVRKMKLVTQDKIKEAYGVLKEVESKLNPSPTQTKDQHEDMLRRLSDRFYDLIPHATTDGANLPVIKSTDAIKEKSALLGSLTDLEIAQRLIAQSGGADTLNMNPIDVNYRKLRAKIVPLEQYRTEYELIKNMVLNTYSDGFKFKAELLNVFEVEREGETDRFAPYKKLPHHRLLFHGSRTTNYIGILSQGLRIAPPEAPVTGYFLGKGIYLADMVSVSAQYCRAKPEHPIGYLLLVDSALGRQFQLAHGKSIAKEDLDEAGFHSVKCCGMLGPLAGYDVTTPDGLIVSLGREGKSGVPVSELIHNEYVVYAPEQTLIKYLIKVKFTFFDKSPALEAGTSL